MSILSSFQIPHSDSPHSLVDLPNRRGTTTTLLLGENGTRKSLLLRAVVDDALRAISLEGDVSVDDEWNDAMTTKFYQKPTQVVAISAVPTDRFPSKAQTGDIGSRGMYGSPRYVYLGPRTARNIVSRNQSIFEFVVALMKSPDKFEKKARFISKLARKASLPQQCVLAIGISFRRDLLAMSQEDFMVAIQGDSHLYRYHPSVVESLKAPQVIKHVKKLLHDIEGISTNKSLSNRRNQGTELYVSVDFKSGRIDPHTTSIDAIYWGLVLGVLLVRRIEFQTDDNKLTTQSAPSAGQWSLFSTLASLSLVVEDGTLVLVDEPESTLHPKWQREYLDDLNDAISGFKDCHIVVATHSPLIASSMHRDRDQVVRLFAKGDEINAEILETPDGWTANDVLEEIFDLPTTRSNELAKLLGRALKIIGGGLEGHEAELKKLEAPLKGYLDFLPESDVARNLIQSILSLVKPAAKKSLKSKRV